MAICHLVLELFCLLVAKNMTCALRICADYAEVMNMIKFLKSHCFDIKSAAFFVGLK